MINLEVQKYCENCPEFEADVDKTSYISSSMQSIHESFCNTVITCKHRERCACLIKLFAMSEEDSGEQHNKN